MIGEVRVVDDVAGAFADLAAETITSGGLDPFVLGCSGGSSGAACFAALSKRELAWSTLELVFADERCVPPSSPDNNGRAIAEALGERIDQVAGFHPMSCEEGPDRYAEVLARFGRIDLLQLGLGPDGHTASIFPNSEEFLAPSATLVARNVDPTGGNVHERLTLTRKGLALARRTVVTVVGADKHDAYQALQNGKPLPGAIADGRSTIWLVGRNAAGASR